MLRGLLAAALLLAAADLSASVRCCLGDGYLAVVFDSTSAARGTGKVFLIDGRGNLGNPLAFTFKADGDVTRLSCDPGGFRAAIGADEIPFDLTAPGVVAARPRRPATRPSGRDTALDAGCYTEERLLDVPGWPNVWYLAEDFDDDDVKKRVYTKKIFLRRYQPGDIPPGRLLQEILIHTYPVFCAGEE